MTTSNGEIAAPPLYVTVKFQDEVAWAGANPLGDGFCFGLEDGRFVFVDESGQVISRPRQGSEAGEAVNGVAGINRADDETFAFLGYAFGRNYSPRTAAYIVRRFRFISFAYGALFAS